MEQMMLAKAGKVFLPENNVDDALLTMACLEAAYKSTESKGVAMLTDLK